MRIALIAALLSAAATLPAQAQQTAGEFILATPCLMAYRMWLQAQGQPFVEPPDTTAEQCAEAKRINEEVLPAKLATESREYEARKAAEARVKAQREQAALAAWRRRAVPTIGMTAKQVEDSRWGLPSHRNITRDARGVHEQWVYGSGDYIYLSNGKVTSIQERLN